MNIGDILFVYGRAGTFISRLICFFSKSEFSHVAQVIGFSPNGSEIVAEDLYNGSIIRSNPYRKEAYVLKTWTKPLSTKEEKTLIQYHYDTGGTYYAYHQLFRIAFYLFFSLSRRRSQELINIRDPSICSEKIHETSILLGRDLRPDINPGLVTPQDLFESELLREIPLRSLKI